MIGGIDMLGMRSFTLKSKTEATETIVKKKLPVGFATDAQPIFLSTRGKTNYYQYPEHLSTVPANKWKPSYGQLCDAHVNIKNQSGQTVVQVIVQPPIIFGKPDVRYLVSEANALETSQNMALAVSIAKTLRRNGLYIFKLDVTPRIESGNSHINHW